MGCLTYLDSSFINKADEWATRNSYVVFTCVSCKINSRSVWCNENFMRTQLWLKGNITFSQHQSGWNSGNCFVDGRRTAPRQAVDGISSRITLFDKWRRSNFCFPGKRTTPVDNESSTTMQKLWFLSRLARLFSILRNYCKVGSIPAENRMHAGSFEFIMCFRTHRQVLINFA